MIDLHYSSHYTIHAGDILINICQGVNRDLTVSRLFRRTVLTWAAICRSKYPRGQCPALSGHTTAPMTSRQLPALHGMCGEFKRGANGSPALTPDSFPAASVSTDNSPLTIAPVLVGLFARARRPRSLHQQHHQPSSPSVPMHDKIQTQDTTDNRRRSKSRRRASFTHGRSRAGCLTCKEKHVCRTR